ncbi:hypothetical protein B5180_09550 [Streptomyces sp. BF-3]|nr:hypothetical protein B5180_09550 [Streptomyces sp. BF-3]SCF72147.1 Predicted arabinose efflux permease, MFS family [Streptomyces sp. Cmuel-A718b]
MKRKFSASRRYSKCGSPDMRVSRGPLKSRNFRLLVTCNVISVAGSSIANVAIPFAVLGVGGSAADVAFVATAKLIPIVAFLLIGGVLADRLPRHRVLVAANGLQAIAAGAAAALILGGHARVWQLAVLAAVSGIGVAMSYPASQGLLPQTVPADQRPSAVSLDRMSRNTASIGGAALGGVLIVLWGPGWGLVFDAASFAIAGALRFRMQFPDLPRVQVSSMLTDLRAGWRAFTSRRWLWMIVAQAAVITTLSSALISVLGPLVAHSDLDGASSWGFIVAAYGFGAVVGGFVLLRFRPKRLLLAGILSLPALSLLFFALAVPLSTPLGVAASFLAGAFLEVFEVSWVITLQQEIPPDELSRISSYDALGNYALAPVGIAAAGGLAGSFGASVILTFSGALIVLLTCAVLFVPEVRHMRRRLPAPSGTGNAVTVPSAAGDN